MDESPQQEFSWSFPAESEEVEGLKKIAAELRWVH